MTFLSATQKIFAIKHIKNDENIIRDREFLSKLIVDILVICIMSIKRCNKYFWASNDYTFPNPTAENK
jgi:hypothetical protein